MANSPFCTRLTDLIARQRAVIERPNKVNDTWYNGVVDRYEHPVLTSAHTPLYWRFDLDENANPLLIERLGVNAAFNPGAMYFDGKYCMMVRVEGIDRKSFFAVAESETGIDNFRYRDYPIVLPETDDPDTNVYDMRLVEHEDGWIYGMFCTERKDPNAPPGDESSAVAQCGLARTKNLDDWERLPDIRTSAPQQRNVVLHPEFVNGKYAFYTRPADEFISAGSKGGIGWGLCEDIGNAVIPEETIMDPKVYHTIKEVKNGMGPAPLKTEKGWLHVLHGVRNTAAGLRYVLYAYLCDLDDPSRILHRPGGYLMAPVGDERIGDVSNVLFCNGAVMRDDGRIFIYYASSDTRVHVATSTVDRMLDYVVNTPEDPLRSYACVQQRRALIARNLELMRGGDPLLSQVL